MAYHADPASEAEVARLVLHELSLATRVMEDPADSYAVLASLTSAMRSLQQVLTQLADAHDRLADQVTDPVGDQTAGRRIAAQAATELRTSAAQLGTATQTVNEAWAANGQLVWTPPKPPTAGGRCRPLPTARAPADDGCRAAWRA